MVQRSNLIIIEVPRFHLVTYHPPLPIFRVPVGGLVTFIITLGLLSWMYPVYFFSPFELPRVSAKLGVTRMSGIHDRSYIVFSRSRLGKPPGPSYRTWEGCTIHDLPSQTVEVVSNSSSWFPLSSVGLLGSLLFERALPAAPPLRRLRAPRGSILSWTSS